MTLELKQKFLRILKELLVRVREVKVDHFEFNPDLQVLLVLTA